MIWSVGVCFSLPLSVMTRMLNTLDIPILLVQLVENPPWTKRKNGTKRERERERERERQRERQRERDVFNLSIVRNLHVASFYP